MSLFHRKTFAAISVTAAAIASTALFSSPAQAASAGAAKVVGSSTVQFNALLGKSNGLVITIKGRTVTLNDKVAIKAGKGCKAVKGDKTKVKCTTKKKTKTLSVALGDKNDTVNNKTGVYMLADGGSGNDTLVGGKAVDQLQGASGNDRLTGNNGDDVLLGESGVDTITGGAGRDYLDGAGSNDVLRGDAGDDLVVGGAGNDKLFGGAGGDDLEGEAGADTIQGDAGVDIVLGGAGHDKINAGAGNDTVVGEAGNDTIAGAAGDDKLFGESLNAAGDQVGSDAARDVVDGGTQVLGDFCLVMAAGTTVNCENIVDSAAVDFVPTQIGAAQALLADARSASAAK